MGFFLGELKYCEFAQNAVKHQKNIVLVETLWLEKDCTLI